MSNAGPREPFFFACRRCTRRGRYSKATLIAQFGEGFDALALPQAVARWRSCALMDTTDGWGRPLCGIYLDLATKIMTEKRARQGHDRH